MWKLKRHRYKFLSNDKRKRSILNSNYFLITIVTRINDLHSSNISINRPASCLAVSRLVNKYVYVSFLLKPEQIRDIKSARKCVLFEDNCSKDRIHWSYEPRFEFQSLWNKCSILFVFNSIHKIQTVL